MEIESYFPKEIKKYKLKKVIKKYLKKYQTTFKRNTK